MNVMHETIKQLQENDKNCNDIHVVKNFLTMGPRKKWQKTYHYR